MRKLSQALALAGLITAPAIVFAETPPAQMPEMSEKPGAAATGLPFDHAGHIDIGYTNLSGSGKFINNINNRVFDFDRNATNIHAIDLTFSKLP